MDNVFKLLIIIIVIFYIIKFIYFVWDHSTRPERFANALLEIKAIGGKVVYQNETTGTISYTKNGVRHQVSVYRGYNSHARW